MECQVVEEEREDRGEFVELTYRGTGTCDAIQCSTSSFVPLWVLELRQRKLCLCS